MANSIVISSGHGAKVAGAIGILNEHNEAVKVVEKVAEYLRQLGVTVNTFHDNTSTTQNQNLSTIVNFHNNKDRELDVSVHFNAASRTDQPRGTEVLYITESELSSRLSSVISSSSGLINRGGKQDKGLYFLKQTKKPAVLIEVCFVDSSADAKLYQAKFDDICKAIAETLSGKKLPSPQPKTVHVFTGGYSGQALADIHAYIAGCKWWFQPSKNDDGTISFLVGGFEEGSQALIAFENYLKSKNYWYEIR